MKTQRKTKITKKFQNGLSALEFYVWLMLKQNSLWLYGNQGRRCDAVSPIVLQDHDQIMLISPLAINPYQSINQIYLKSILKYSKLYRNNKQKICVPNKNRLH